MSQDKNKTLQQTADLQKNFGTHLSFSAKEAFKRLRTNVLFSFTGQQGCRVICVTSSMRGEGKSTTSTNLAYSLAEMGKHVLLIDADMRLPTVQKYMDIRQAPGLSNLLTGINNSENLVQESGVHPNLFVITAGDIPPNPSELLASRHMSEALELLKKSFDYIVIDLPPIEAVTDAMIVAHLTDGVVLVVRHNYVDKSALDNAIRQLKYQNINIIGIVYNGAETESKYYRHGYYKKGYYSKYYHSDSYGGENYDESTPDAAMTAAVNARIQQGHKDGGKRQ